MPVFCFSCFGGENQLAPNNGDVKQLHLNHAMAEEIVPLDADLILAGEFDAPDAVQLLQKLNQPVKRLKTPQSLQDIQEQWLVLGELTGETTSATLLADQFQGEIQALTLLANQTQHMRVFWYSLNGVVVGEGTLENELMSLAGLQNIAVEKKIAGFSPLDLEIVLAAKPDALIIEDESTDYYSLAKEFLHHPALSQHQMKIIRLPSGFSSCSSSMVSDFTQAIKNHFSPQGS